MRGRSSAGPATSLLGRPLDGTSFGSIASGYLPVWDGTKFVAQLLTATPGANATLSAQADANGLGNVGGGEDDLFSFSVPGGTLSTDGDAIEFLATVRVRNASAAGTQTTRVRWGASVLLQFADTGANSNYYVIHGFITRVGAASQTGFVQLVRDPTGGGNVTSVAVAAAAETLSGAVILKVTGEDSTPTSDNVEAFSFFVRLLKETP